MAQLESNRPAKTPPDQPENAQTGKAGADTPQQVNAKPAGAQTVKNLKQNQPKKRIGTGTWVLIVVLLAALGGGGWWAYQRYSPKPPSFMTVGVQKRDIVKRVFATGTVEGRTQVDVGAQVSGQILKLYVKTGDEVKKGDPLCDIDPETQEHSLKTAESEIKITSAKITAKKAEIVKLNAELKRQQKLSRIDATTQQDVESAQASYEIAQAELEQLEEEYKQNQISLEDAKTNLGYTKITAPMDGTIYGVVVDEGQTVNANQTTPTILRMADMTTMTIKTEISEADVVSVKTGMPCTFTILGLPHHDFKATLGRIAPAPATAEESTDSTTSSSSSSSSTAIYYNADLDVDNSERILRIDMTADVTITVDSRQGVLALPLTALRSEGSDTAEVYVLGPQGLPERRKVQIGLKDDQFIEIVSGLSEQDRVVIGDDVASAENAAMEKERSRRPPGPF